MIRISIILIMKKRERLAPNSLDASRCASIIALSANDPEFKKHIFKLKTIAHQQTAKGAQKGGLGNNESHPIHQTQELPGSALSPIRKDWIQGGAFARPLSNRAISYGSYRDVR